ncbi:DNA integrity scanning protein DisA nucleotide-binding domain protein, partial [Schleiferiaceae bacterium]|nr:DNA integrity scanning protein DisA nucleotide-binding domain protein [Schleiferiaceae bacterium]
NLGATVSRIVLETIFFKNAPLHDGATIITGNTVSAAGAILPLSESNELPSQFGLRHRAAAGISERTDAMALTVSDEPRMALSNHACHKLRHHHQCGFIFYGTQL